MDKLITNFAADQADTETKPKNTISSTAMMTSVLSGPASNQSLAVQQFQKLHQKRFGKHRAHGDSKKLAQALNNPADTQSIELAVDKFINNRLTNSEFRKSLTTNMLFATGLVSPEKVERSPENKLFFKRKT